MALHQLRLRGRSLSIGAMAILTSQQRLSRGVDSPGFGILRHARLLQHPWRQLCNLPEIKVAHLKKPGETIAAPVGRDASETAQSGPDQSIGGADMSTVPDQSLDPSLDPALAGHPSPSVTSLPVQQQQEQPDEGTSAGNSPFLLPPLPPRPSDDPDTGAVPADASSSTAMAIFTDAPEAKPSNRKGAVSTTVRAKRELKAERSATGKGMKARDARLAGDEYEFCELSLEERAHTSRADLLARYGPERLRVAADPESCYASLTGSHERVSFSYCAHECKAWQPG